MKVDLTRKQIIRLICDIEVSYQQDGYNGDKKTWLERQRIIDKLTKALDVNLKYKRV